MGTRDDFTNSVKAVLAKRSGTLCSNPDCCAPTYGPTEDPSKASNVGIAAHIEGAAPGSPRYNGNQSAEDRRSIGNGIWLCQNCAKLVDDDPAKYTVEILKQWKEAAEQRARVAQGNKAAVRADVPLPRSVLLVVRQMSTAWPQTETVHQWGRLWHRARLTYRPISMPRALKDAWTPVVFKSDLLKPGLVLYNVVYQNQGDVIDERIRIGIDLHGAGIEEVVLPKSQRMRVVEGGERTSSFVALHMQEALPGERQMAQVIAKRGETPEVSFWTELQGTSKEVYIVDLVYQPDTQ